MKNTAKLMLVLLLASSLVTTVFALTLIYTQIFSMNVKSGPSVQWTSGYNLGDVYQGASYNMSIPTNPSTSNCSISTNGFSGSMTVAFNSVPSSAIFSSFVVDVYAINGTKVGSFNMSPTSWTHTVSPNQYFYYRFVFTVNDAATGSVQIQVKVSFTG